MEEYARHVPSYGIGPVDAGNCCLCPYLYMGAYKIRKLKIGLKLLQRESAETILITPMTVKSEDL